MSSIERSNSTPNIVMFRCSRDFKLSVLLDLAGDGDNRLVIADLGSGNFNMKLRVFRGTQQVRVEKNQVRNNVLFEYG